MACNLNDYKSTKNEPEPFSYRTSKYVKDSGPGFVHEEELGFGLLSHTCWGSKLKKLDVRVHPAKDISY